MEPTSVDKKTDLVENGSPVIETRKTIKRIDGRYLIGEIQSVLSFEKGFLFTIRELSIHPGRSVREFLMEDRKRLVRPVFFLILTSLIYTFFNRVFRFEDSYINYSGSDETAVQAVFGWIQNNYGYANIIMALFIAGWSKLFFRKYGFNIFEILVLLCYIMGMGMLIFSVFGFIQSLTGLKLLQLAALIGFVYLTWAIGQFFGKGKIFNYLKALFAYLLGTFTFSIAAIILGFIIDLLS